MKEGIAMDFDGDGKENLVEVLKDWVSSNSFVINDAGKYVMKSNSVLYYGEKTGMVLETLMEMEKWTSWFLKDGDVQLEIIYEFW